MTDEYRRQRRQKQLADILARLGGSEDRCRYCGALVGVGIEALHLGVCDDPECQKQKASGEAGLDEDDNERDD